jgi:hypothetical protein
MRFMACIYDKHTLLSSEIRIPAGLSDRHNNADLGSNHV